MHSLRRASYDTRNPRSRRFFPDFFPWTERRFFPQHYAVLLVSCVGTRVLSYHSVGLHEGRQRHRRNHNLKAQIRITKSLPPRRGTERQSGWRLKVYTASPHSRRLHGSAAAHHGCGARRLKF